MICSAIGWVGDALTNSTNSQTAQYFAKRIWVSIPRVRGSPFLVRDPNLMELNDILADAKELCYRVAPAELSGFFLCALVPLCETFVCYRLGFSRRHEGTEI